MSSYKKQKQSYRGDTFFHSVSAALEGIVHVLKQERSMRLHFLIGFLVVIMGIYLGLSSVEFMILCLAVSFVLVSEMVNTAIEHFVDIMREEFHPVAKIVKDIAAAAVFVSAVNATIVGYFLIIKQLDFGLKDSFLRIKQSPWHITLIALLIVVGLVLFVKILRGERSLLRGGMPSGHTAVAFAIWTAVSLVTGNILVSVLVLLLALIIARSRLINGLHTLWEIIAGAFLGTLVTLLVFQLLS